MGSPSRRLVALIALSSWAIAILAWGCIPKKLPTSEPGRSGMPTGVYNTGTPPEPWDIDIESLPLYPGSKQFGSKFTFLAPEPYARVLSFYKEKLPNAETTETPGSSPSIIFKTDLFILKLSIAEGGQNTLIVFSRPKK